MQYIHKQDVGVLPPQRALNLGKIERSLSAVPFFPDSGEHRRLGTQRVERPRVQPLADTLLFEKPTVPGTVPRQGSLPGNGEGYTMAALQHLLVAADRYGLENLKVMCEEKLCKGIDVKTVTTTLALAEQHFCARLKDACLTYIMSSREVIGAVLATDGYKHLKDSSPLVFEEVLEHGV